MGIRSYIKENKVLLADGAMGTYYYEKCGQKSTLSEKANISSLNDIIEIHKEYIKNGARLIRTNSFAANWCFSIKSAMYLAVLKFFY